MEGYKKELESISRPFTRLFSFFVALCCLAAVLLGDEDKIEKYIFIVVLTLVLYSWLIKPLTKRLKIELGDSKLFTEERILNIIYDKAEYTVEKIEFPRKICDVEEDSYWNFGGIHLRDRTPNILCFEYEKKEIRLGISYQWDDVDSLINEIIRRKNNR